MAKLQIWQEGVEALHANRARAFNFVVHTEAIYGLLHVR